jgi:hypothetical protein
MMLNVVMVSVVKLNDVMPSYKMIDFRGLNYKIVYAFRTFCQHDTLSIHHFVNQNILMRGDLNEG